jgi:predicted nucleotidyltransferase/HEPN domain-containing protein
MDLSQLLPKLPPEKRSEIQKALYIILEVSNPEKVILFGSYAKGKWVDDITVEDGVTFHYQSDFDFLVVIKENSTKEFELKSKIENRAVNSVRGIVSPLVHSIDYINEGLSIGQYFFKEIIEEGILLFDTGNSSFVSPTELSPFQMLERAQEYFDFWYPMASEFFIDGKAALNRKSLRVSNFHLHQSVEHLYATVLLVFTGYKPKSHNLQNLRDYSKNISSELYSIFLDPNSSDSETQIFKILKKGYIDARYKNDYKISFGELDQAMKKVEEVKNLIEKICQTELDRLRNLI